MKTTSDREFLTELNANGCFVALDTETTGLSAGSNEIIEIGAVRYRNWEPVEEFSYLIRPARPIPYFITQITGISNAMVRDCPCFCELVDDLMEFIGEGPVVGHNIHFDYAFLCAGGAPLEDRDLKFADTMYISRKLLPKGDKIENHQLGTLCRYYGVVNTNAHRATDDAKATAMVLRGLLKDMEEIL